MNQTKRILSIAMALVALACFSPVMAQGSYPKGDVNRDGSVNVADIATIIDVMAGKTNGTSATVADVNNDGSVNVADISMVIDIMAGKIVLPQAPADAKGIDLGLPSGTLWANMNVGAEAQNEYGLYFAWGETTGYSGPNEGRTFNWRSYKWMAEGKSLWLNIKKYTFADGNTTADWYNAYEEFIGDGKTELFLEDDAARAYWGGEWCMPTSEHIQELLDNTYSEWYTLEGVDGYKFTSKKNGNSIFLPAAGCILNNALQNSGKCGYYSSSSLDTSAGVYAAQDIWLHSDGCEINNYNRYIACSVRPIIKGGNTIPVDPETTDSLKAVNLNLPSGTLWANMNVGATKPEEDGLYFAWGETNGYTSGHSFNWEHYKWIEEGWADISEDLELGINKYQVDDGEEGIWYHFDYEEEWDIFVGDNKKVLDPEDDAAFSNWGSKWRMPTKKDFQELLDNTTSSECTVKGVKGIKFSSSGKSIFLPYANQSTGGYYWSSSLYTYRTTSANYLNISSEGVELNINSRCYGYMVRPVQRK